MACEEISEVSQVRNLSQATVSLQKRSRLAERFKQCNGHLLKLVAAVPLAAVVLPSSDD
jgi:hypothetical protein